MDERLILALAFSFIGFLLGLMLPKFFDRRAENRGQAPSKPVPPAPYQSGDHSVKTQSPKRPLPPAPRRNYEPPFPPPRPK